MVTSHIENKQLKKMTDIVCGAIYCLEFHKGQF